MQKPTVEDGLEDDLRERCAEVPAVGEQLRAEYAKAREAQRTAQAFEVWRDDYLTQVGVAWILGCVFVRFMEDNDLVSPARLAGPGERLAMARDQHTMFFRQHPRETDREYLLHVFEEVARLPGAAGLFDKRHNPIWEMAPSGDGAAKLLEFWRQIEPETGALRHDFTDPVTPTGGWNTRFLGDLYQDLSESARKKYALLQTPEFVEEFILDRTLTPAIDEFGYQQVRMIDPACGSGHFLLGGFHRLFKLHVRHEPGTNPRELAQRALNQVYGVDLNPFAVAIARFRLLVAALKACDIHRLADAPGFAINLAAGDSLLHGPRPGSYGIRTQYLQGFEEGDPLRHVYHAEDKDELRRILGQQYHVVVGNPPYITPKDAALNQAYRERFGSCHMKYSLAVPFKERMFDLAIAPENGQAAPAGYVGMITANSFMKREFGKKLIEQYLAKIDLTHVIDTSGAYIPGHGTPTVILFVRQRKPVAATIRAVMGIKGEPATPADPAQGVVWSAILDQIDRAGSQSAFVSVSDTPREQFGKHPWSIGGGGAAELKEMLDENAAALLSKVVEVVGIFGMTNADDVMLAPDAAFMRRRVESHLHCPLVIGDQVRDWCVAIGDRVLFPYEREVLQGVGETPGFHRWIWRCRTVMGNRATFGKSTYFGEGRPWWEWHQVCLDRLRKPLSIVFGEVATHNHFVLDRGGKVFNRTAPVIKLPADASEDDHLVLLGLLNSSTSCFWMKQVAHQKQMMGGDGIRISEKCKVPYPFNATMLEKLPIPAAWTSGPLRERLLSLTREMDRVAAERQTLNAKAALAVGIDSVKAVYSRWSQSRARVQQLRSRMIVLQEEIDFTVYVMFGLCQSDVLGGKTEWADVAVGAGDRPFCILSQANPDGFPVPAGIPQSWPDDLHSLWARRIDAIRNSAELRLIEDPHYKRRWIGVQGLFNSKRTQDELADACRNWLLDRLESYFDSDGRMNDEHRPTARVPMELMSCAKLADVTRTDGDFVQAGELYRGHADFDVAELVAELVENESAPFLPVLRYKDTGLRKRAVWEQVWELQRAEDAIDERTKLPEGNPQRLTGEQARQLKAEQVGDIPVPPKYTSADFANSTWWRLRGKLDVPKERWVSYPHCSREADPSLVIGWAGWNHLQQAQALAAYHVAMKETEGWSTERLIPLLAGLLELLPWVKQWHNELNPDVSMGLGDYYQSFVDEEARSLGLTKEAIRAWAPEKKGRGRKAKGRKSEERRMKSKDRIE